MIDAAKTAQADGRGAFVLNGTMVDAPIIERAHDVLEQAGDLG
ncbi:hypothetical protein [Ensifer sp. SL37]|nr:hypothetical protein [Ensifer sp. SL37]MCY1745798.1 hypothetical protein [Ensifer sp. SL37]